MLWHFPLIDTRQTGMVVPAQRAFESLEQDAHVGLLAPITVPLHIKDILVWRVEVLSDDHSPDRSMAMTESSKIHADLAYEDITNIAPLSPLVVGDFFQAEIAKHLCRIRWFAQSFSVCEAFEARKRQILAKVVEQCVSYTEACLRMFMQPLHVWPSDCVRQLKSLRKACR